MEIKAVLFDMDGVLVDTEAYYMKGTLDWMKNLGYQGTFKDVCSLIGTTMEVTYLMIEKMLDYRYTVDELREINERYFLVEHPIPYDQIMKKGLVELLCEIKNKGWKCAVCSSSPKQTIDHALRMCKIEHYCDYVVSGDQFVESKPNPEIYLHAADILNVKPVECIVIEDSRMGIEAGRNAGMRTIGLMDRRFAQVQANANILVEELTEVLDSVKYL